MTEQHRKEESPGVIPAALLCQRCDPETLPFRTTAELEDADALFGQPRAEAAIRLAADLDREGYNLFVMGAPGAGKRSKIIGFLDGRCAGSPLSDWVYVHNFTDPHRPVALRLPAGRGAALREDMRALVEEVRASVTTVFESEEYRARAGQIEADFTERHERAFSGLVADSAAQNIALVRTPAGFTFAPLKEGEVISADDYAKLPEDDKTRIQEIIAGLQKKLEAIIGDMVEWRREWRTRARQLNRDMMQFAVNHPIAEVKARYAGVPAVESYLDGVAADIVANGDDLQPQAQQQGQGSPAGRTEAESLLRYRVNLVVGHDNQNLPVVFEEHPTYQNLIGRVEHVAQFGMLMTDFMQIKAGALHRANGGFLLVDARRLLMQPFAYDALKRALAARQMRLESMAEMYSPVSTVSLAPEPIPLDVKVVLFGGRELYYTLCAYDPDFTALFKVVADIDDDFPRTEDNMLGYARMIASIGKRQRLRAVDRRGVARIIEYGAREAGEARRLTANVQAIADLLCEADHHAAVMGSATITHEHIEAALGAQRGRADRVHRNLHDAIMRGTLLIDTSGRKVGQINGLSVFDMGGVSFSEPTRITATTRIGDGRVVDVQREVEMGGSIHSKGVLILSSFLAARYSGRQALSLTASLVFEQTYGMVDGDSASLAELCALLSSLSEMPIMQSYAVTGSVNQLGEVQAIGGVNEKVEGFFGLCEARGLTGEQGVIIPASNVQNLMLDARIVEAVERSKFSVHAVSRVDDAIMLLTGVDAGTQDALGDYPPHSINGLVSRRLREYANRRAGERRRTRAGRSGSSEGMR